MTKTSRTRALLDVQAGWILVDAAGQIVAEAGNDSLPPEGDPTRHAELLAAALAARHLPPEVLAGATLYSSAEPCAMCAGAIYWCGIGRVVYALSEHALLGLTGAGQLPFAEGLAHLAASLPHVAGDYMGEHWLATFALLALEGAD